MLSLKSPFFRAKLLHLIHQTLEEFKGQTICDRVVQIFHSNEGEILFLNALSFGKKNHYLNIEVRKHTLFS